MSIIAAPSEPCPLEYTAFAVSPQLRHDFAACLTDQ
ncbi:hypothetical protein SCAR479_06652 [Seiridium cardinale]|uniref:Uncharacterized protein n=1 Tax=Seiridium cardinale TaxID=138064 RepID=A0ABR2XS48_9PEZI